MSLHPSHMFQAVEISVCKSLFIYFWCLSVCLCISQKFQAAKVSICNDVFALVKGFKQRNSVLVTISLHESKVSSSEMVKVSVYNDFFRISQKFQAAKVSVSKDVKWHS